MYATTTVNVFLTSTTENHFQLAAMIAQVRDVLGWHYRFTQVGAISHSREDNKPVFKMFWLVAFLCGVGLTIYGLIGFVNNIQKYEVNTSVFVEKKPSLHFPAHHCLQQEHNSLSAFVRHDCGL